jgi:hypothetical protein
MFKRLGALVAQLICAFVLTLSLAGAANAASYLDPKLTDLKPEEKVVVAKPQPVQLVFQFQTNGAANARAAKYLKKSVTETITASGAFSEVSETPVAGGAILSITINNYGDAKAAAGSGFVTGLTFGLKGTTVVDNYTCTAEYLPGLTGAKLTREVHHALITTLGATSAPEGGIKVKNATEGVMTVTKQVVSHAVNDLAGDPGFAIAAAPAPILAPAPTLSPAPATAPTEATPPAVAPAAEAKAAA